MAFQMVRSFFGQRSPSRSRVHEPVIESEDFGGQEGPARYDSRDVGKTAIDPSWSELARQGKETNREGRKPHTPLSYSAMKLFSNNSNLQGGSKTVEHLTFTM